MYNPGDRVRLVDGKQRLLIVGTIRRKVPGGWQVSWDGDTKLDVRAYPAAQLQPEKT